MALPEVFFFLDYFSPLPHSTHQARVLSNVSTVYKLKEERDVGYQALGYPDRSIDGAECTPQLDKVDALAALAQFHCPCPCFSCLGWLITTQQLLLHHGLQREY
jgi:hypothetical protein